MNAEIEYKNGIMTFRFNGNRVAINPRSVPANNPWLRTILADMAREFKYGDENPTTRSFGRDELEMIMEYGRSNRYGSLRSNLIRLAHSQPELRPHLLPILKEAGNPDFAFGGPEGAEAIRNWLYALNRAIRADAPVRRDEYRELLDLILMNLDYVAGTVYEDTRPYFVNLRTLVRTSPLRPEAYAALKILTRATNPGTIRRALLALTKTLLPAPETPAPSDPV